MLGLGLSLTSPRIIGTLVSPGPDPDPVAVTLRNLGDPGPSSTNDFQTEVFYTAVVDTGVNEQTIYTYEVVIPGVILDSIFYFQIPTKEEEYQEQAGTNSAYTQGNISAITTTFNVAGGVKVSVPASENDASSQTASVFQKFVEYFIQNPEVISAVFGNTAQELGGNFTYLSSESNGSNAIVNSHRYIFAPTANPNSEYYDILNILTNFLFDVTDLEYLYSDEFPAPEFVYSEYQGLEGYTAGTPMTVPFFRENIQVVDTSPAVQPVSIPLPAFGVIPTIAGFVSASPLVSNNGNSFFFNSTPVLGGSVPTSAPDADSLTITFSVSEAYAELNGVSFGNDLSPFGADENGDVDISSFNTTFTIEYQDTDETTLSLTKTIAFTDTGSSHQIPNPLDTATFFKHYSYNGSIVITQEEFPALFSGADNNVLAVEVSVKNIFNYVPGDNNYLQSPILDNPFPGGLYIPSVGVLTEDFLIWLAGIEPETPGTSLSVLPASDNTYDATPPSPSDQPTVISYSNTNKIKNKTVNFAGNKSANFAGTTAFTSTGTDFTFISITSSRAASTGSQLTVNRKSTTEGIGLDSGDIYVKLKNASLPTDTTPGTAPGAGIEDNLPIFNYIEKSGTNMSVYNEFNEETKRFTVGSSDLLEFNRITNAALNGTIAHIAVYDGLFTSVEKAALIEDLRIKYLDVNTINRYE